MTNMSYKWLLHVILFVCTAMDSTQPPPVSTSLCQLVLIGTTLVSTGVGCSTSKAVRVQSTLNPNWLQITGAQQGKFWGLPRCKNLWRFSLFCSYCWVLGLLCWLLCFTSLVSVTGSFTEDEPRFVTKEIYASSIFSDFKVAGLIKKQHRK